MKNSYLDEHYITDDEAYINVLDELPLWSAPFGKVLLETIEMKKNMNVLDIGSGTGFPLIEIAQRLGDSSTIYGIDPWESSIERIDLKTQYCNINNVKMFLGLAENLPFDDNFFDLIVSNNGINNVADQGNTIAECYRTARKNCQLVYSWNLPESMMEFYNIFENTLSELNLENEIELMKSHISHKRKTIEETKTLFENGGFKVENIKTDSFFMRFIDGTAMLNHFLIKIGFLPSWVEVIEGQDKYKIFDIIENKLNAKAEHEGELQLIIPFACISCRK